MELAVGPVLVEPDPVSASRESGLRIVFHGRSGEGDDAGLLE
jgi:hypothetical protein